MQINKKLTATFTGAALTGALALGVGACSSGASGYHNQATLKASVSQKLDGWFKNNYSQAPDGTHEKVLVSQIILTPTRPNTDIAYVRTNESDGSERGHDSTIMTIHIAPDGSTWIAPASTWTGIDF